MKIAIIDYGVGNLFSVKNAMEKISKSKVLITTEPRVLENADLIILPGVGKFNAASKRLKQFKEVIFSSLEENAVLFGICLGMQLLFSRSEEGPSEGLNLLPGYNIKLPDIVKTPHMGWNTIRIIKWHEIVDGIEDGSYFYFVHSYHPITEKREIIIAETEYGVSFPSIVAEGSICGTQFHPEKSGKTGFKLLKNLLKFVKG